MNTHAPLSSVTIVVSVVVDCPVTKKGENIFSFGEEKETEEEWRPGPGGGLWWGWCRGQGAAWRPLGQADQLGSM